MYEVVVGIDFGSSGSGFAYSFKNENSINHGYIYGSNVDNKVPTEIILDDNSYIVQFGATCKQYLKEKGLKAGHYFKDIKMKLYKKERFIKSSNSEKILPLKLVIQKVLEKIKELCMEELKKLWNKINESSIKWVVTVPAIWEDFQKNIMMEACINASLINENTDKSLFFALEPEAASLYCSRNKDIKQEYLMKGKYYIICDLGGGTGDIVTHLVGNNKNLEEINSACGGNYGSNEIDKKIFEEIIYKIFGYKDFTSLSKKIKELNINEDNEVIFEGWCELERLIKDYKEGANLEKINKKLFFTINCSLFQDFFDEDIDINNLIDKYNKECNDTDLKLNIKSKKKWIIEFPYKIIYNYIKNQALLIVKTIKNIIYKSQFSINSVIFVGGYCSNEILIHLIKSNLKRANLTFLQPSKPCLAIMEGAVLFGLNPNIISSRIARYTIGTDVRLIWDDEKHSKMGRKVFDKVNNRWDCEDCFSKFIEINQKIKIDQEITNTYTMTGPRYCKMEFFQTLNPNPYYTFEKGIEKIGECTLDAGKDYPPDERLIKLTMKFGGTFIDVKAIHVKSGAEIKTLLEFK